MSSIDRETSGIREQESPVEQKQELNVEEKRENAEVEKNGTSSTPESESRPVHQS
jgi:hypothetical protein